MSTDLLPHCSGRVTRGRSVTTARLADGRHLVLVVDLHPERIVTEVITAEPPTKADVRRIVEGCAQ